MPMMAVATFALVAGMMDDLLSRKVHNHLVIALAVLIAFCNLYFRGVSDSLIGVAAMLLALIVTIPLFMARALGGGDVKLFAVFAFAVDPVSMFWTLIYSFIWGALFGVSRAMLSNQLLALVRNTYRIASRQKSEVREVQKIPYTFALLLGWFTQLTLMRIGGLL